MDISHYPVFRSDLLSALQQSSSLRALRALQGLCALPFTQHWQSSLHELANETEQLLTAYTTQGRQSQTSDKATQLLQAFHQMGENIDHHYLLLHSQQQRAQLFRDAQQQLSLTAFLHHLHPAAHPCQLFNALWVSHFWTVAERHEVFRFLQAESTGDLLRGTALAAIVQSLLSHFDVQKMELLLALINDRQHDMCYERALSGLVLTAVQHHKWLHLYPEIGVQLEQLTLTEATRWHLDDLQKVLLTLAHQKSHMQEVEATRQRLTTATQPIADALASDDDYILEEAAEFFQQLDELQYINALQTHGLDQHYQTFSHRMRSLPQFQEAALWFIPFSPQYPDFTPAQTAIAPTVEQSNDYSTHADRYAEVFLAIDPSPKSKEVPQNATLRITTPEYGEFSIQFSNQLLGKEEPPHQAPLQEARLFLRALYRYYHLFPYRNEQENPFRRDLHLAEYTYFQPLYEMGDTAESLASYFRQGKLFEEAIQMLERLKHPTIFATLRLAQCYKKLGNREQYFRILEEAYGKYTGSMEQELLCHELALSLFQHQQFERAIPYLQQMVNPDSMSDELWEMRLATCLHHLGRNAEALPLLHKVHYFAPETPFIRFIIACSLTCVGRFEEAENYFSPILENSTEERDFYFAGHNAWLSGNIPLAIARYAQSLRLAHLPKATASFFSEEEEELRKLGLTTLDFALMTDLINEHLSAAAS